MSHTYIYHGITLVSDFSFPELRLSSTHIKDDFISIRQTDLSTIYEQHKNDLVGGIASIGKTLLFDIENVGKFYFPNTNSVEIELAPETNWDTARPYVYSNVLTTLLQMRGLFTIHGSAIVHKGKLHAFCGQSGAGKSTLLSQLLEKKHKIYCDDRIVLSYHKEQNQLLAYPGTGQLRLHSDSIQELTLPEELGERHKVAYKKDKWEYDLSDKIVNEILPLERIYVLQRQDVDKLQNWTVKGHEKLHVLRRQSFKSQFVNVIGKQAEHFKFLSQIAANIPVEVIRRPLGMSADAFSDYMIDKIAQSSS